MFSTDWLSRAPLDYALEKKRGSAFLCLLLEHGAFSAKVSDAKRVWQLWVSHRVGLFVSYLPFEVSKILLY